MTMSQLAAFTCAMGNTTQTPVLTSTWNGAPSHISSGEALVNLFFHASRGLERESLVKLLKKAWKVSPLLTLKMIAYIRNIRGGKGERDLGRWALEWLTDHHPDDLVCNLEWYLGKFGRWDDGVHLVASTTPQIPEIVYKLYGDQLLRDLAQVESTLGIIPSNVSLCAKWIPSENKAEDRKYGFNRGLARAMGWTHKELRQCLTKLRKNIDLLETHLCERTLDQVEYSKVPSVAMNRHGKKDKAFPRRDGERFDKYKEKLVNGETKVNVGALYPHEVAQKYLTTYGDTGGEPDDLIEGQWRAMCEKLTDLERSYLSGVLTMVDVSGSMYSCANKSVRPLDVAISLGLLISEMNTDPAFHQTVMTFSSDPEFYRVDGVTLHERVQKLRKAHWQMSTDFAKAFRMILTRAKEFGLRQEEIPTTLLVISDMQFDSTGNDTFETNYQALQREFNEAGYQVPKLVFWNVNGSIKDYPVTATQCNTALVSGFSIEILRDVLTGEDITPFRVMMRTLGRADYDCIKAASQQPLLANKLRRQNGGSTSKEDHERIEAAKCLQRTVRGYQERQKINESRKLKRRQAAECIQRAVRRYQAHRKVNLLRRMRALSLFIESPILVEWSSDGSLPSLSPLSSSTRCSLSSVDWDS